MKKLEITNNPEVEPEIDLIQFIHDLAQENGSTEKVYLKLIEKSSGGCDVFCSNSYANSDFTMGYYAVLFLIDKTFGKTASIAYTRPLCGMPPSWFQVRVIDKKKFVEGLK